MPYTPQKTLGYWHQEPIVLVCDDRIDIEQVKEALDIWKAIGSQATFEKTQMHWPAKGLPWDR